MVRTTPAFARAAIVAAAIVMGAGTLGAASPAAAAGTGPQVRLGHFAPGVPKVDVYLSTFDGRQRKVLPGLAYGEVSQYLPVKPGRYAYSMRRAGAPGTAPKLISGFADFVGDASYTFIAIKDGPRVRTKAFIDDNATPAPGSARVRLINTAHTAGPVQVDAVAGPVLADRLALGSASRYATVPGGAWRVRIDGADTTPVEQNLDVQPGTVTTLLVVDGGPTARIMSVVDATGIAGTTAGGLPTTGPVGGVQTGGGGTARTFTSSPDFGAGLRGAGGVGVVLVIGAALIARRRRTAGA